MHNVCISYIFACKNCVYHTSLHKIQHIYIKWHISNSTDCIQRYKCYAFLFNLNWQAGHIYICDYKILDGLPCKDGWFCAAPICLLYVNKKKDLIPIAIQLKQKPGSDNPIFLPTDNWADWTLAKMYYQSACTQVRIFQPTHSCSIEINLVSPPSTTR